MMNAAATMAQPSPSGIQRSTSTSSVQCVADGADLAALDHPGIPTRRRIVTSDCHDRLFVSRKLPLEVQRLIALAGVAGPLVAVGLGEIAHHVVLYAEPVRGRDGG